MYAFSRKISDIEKDRTTLTIQSCNEKILAGISDSIATRRTLTVNVKATNPENRRPERTSGHEKLRLLLHTVTTTVDTKNCNKKPCFNEKCCMYHCSKREHSTFWRGMLQDAKNGGQEKRIS